MSDRKDKIRSKFDDMRFRILVIGRANAGKTTLLQRVCKTTDAPIVHDRHGNKIKVVDVNGIEERGEHDIENEISFESNRHFVFHNSRSFEAGREDELQKVQSWIKKCADSPKLKDRIHAIWYCIPLSDYARAISAAEEAFFSNCGTGKVPVIAIFTKFDALYRVAFGNLREEGKELDEAKAMAAEKALKIFKDNGYEDRLSTFKFPPKDVVHVGNMREEDGKCDALISCTADALDDEVLEGLFVSSQQVNMQVCISFAVNRTMREYLENSKSKEEIDVKELATKLEIWFPTFNEELMLKDHHISAVQSGLHSLIQGSSLNHIAILAASFLIIIHYSFYSWDRKEKGDILATSIKHYLQSPQLSAVIQSISEATQKYENDLDLPVLCQEIIKIVTSCSDEKHVIKQHQFITQKVMKLFKRK